jgi:midasin (ATPase involved in ribosome maturation)
VTLEETFDSKNLVGTYVCNETGEFVFKKGPLTVAAEQGLWLILRNIEDTPSDLLSFLIPLIEQNSLQVSSNFTIRPKLGFRMFALSKSSAHTATSDSHLISQQEEVIEPLMHLLHRTYLEPLLSTHHKTFSLNPRDDL